MSRRLLFSLLFLIFTVSVQAQDEEVVADENSETSTTESDTAETTSASESVTSETSTIVAVRYLCELQGLTRRVEVDYESTGSSVPCSVNYFKDTEAPGEVNTLWSATNIEGYCEEKAAGFIDKLKSWGWSCTGD